MRNRERAHQQPRRRSAAPDLPVRADHPLLALQHAAGNGAVKLVVQRAGPAPRPFGPRAGHIQPASQGVTVELGQTDWSPGTPPGLTVNVRRTRNGQFTARPRLSRAGRPRITARYPSPGLYPIGRSSSGTIYGIVTRAISQLVRRGEQEHSNDADLAQRKVYGAVGRAVRDQARQPASGATEEEARNSCLDGVRSALPTRLQWTAAPTAASPVWRSAVATVMAASVCRDTLNWHSMGTDRATYRDNLRYQPRLAMGDGLMRIEEGGEIGQHSPADIIGEAYQSRIESA